MSPYLQLEIHLFCEKKNRPYINFTLNGNLVQYRYRFNSATLITEDSAKQLMISQFIYDNIQKMLKTLSKVNIRYLFNLINSHKIFF